MEVGEEGLEADAVVVDMEVEEEEEDTVKVCSSKCCNNNYFLFQKCV